MNQVSFLAAIRDEPDDDLPRQVCADWLDDQDDPDRAEFIRIQLELSSARPERARALELLRRLRALIVQHRHRWLGLLGRLSPDAVFQRGFVEQAVLRADDFLRHGDELFSAHPLHRLGLIGIGNLMPEVAASPHLAGLSALDLRENVLHEDVLRSLAGSPHLGRLRELNLARTDTSGAGLEALVTSGRIASLIRLDLHNNPIGNRGAAALAGPPGLPALTMLDLGSARIDDGGVELLASSPHLSRLQVLRLSYNPITRRGAQRLLNSPELAGMRRVELYGSEIGPSARSALLRSSRGRLLC